MTKAFGGIRIVDSTHVLAGPFASYQLGVLGAEVIKLESPHSPDQARLQGSDRGMNDRRMGTSFMAQASNKKAIALDLKSEGGRKALLRLLETADVFVQNFRPGAFDRLGLSYDEVRALNPRLIYCSISAFGATGPRREETGYDNVIQASSGMMAMTGYGDGQPLKSGAQLVDYGTGFAAAFAISAALFQRERTGVGQHIDVSMFDVALMLCSSHIAGLTWNGSHPKAKANRFPFATIGCYRASDTDMMIAASNVAQQRRLWTALGREDLIKSNNNQRLDAHAEEEAALSAIIATRPAAEWEALLRKHRVPASRVRTLAEAIADPQAVARGVVQNAGLRGSGQQELGVALAGFKMSASPAELTSPPQPVGSHTVEVLESLGYGEADIAALKAQGSIG
ncbi:CaiB/BaiF CoA transferase family protein [Bradyrhizobium zhanjiangense]|uniref:CaiB/BaiF CoA transferase family protein n=1 Tax=Bradyrhizobium zhanjiangense TaxID=1325107 RepID=UPI0010090998|nr:CaiB/BaiF CoA-transferase family protein [Bradyrhizobium zhanjiangense]